jgi:RNA polymerase sigma-70 factor (ECF subfamily)
MFGVLNLNYSSLNDESLMRLIVHAQAEALNTLYDRYSRLVYSMAYHAVGDPAVAEEITQDVFFRVWEKAGTYRSEQAKVSTWLTSITRYRAIDVLRRRGARPEKHSIGWEELAFGDEPSVDGPEGAAEQALEGQRVRAAIAGLPLDQRRALSLAYFQGLSHSQIAEQLGEPLGTVKTRIRLAMQKLREVLQDDLRVAP